MREESFWVASSFRRSSSIIKSLVSIMSTDVCCCLSGLYQDTNWQYFFAKKPTSTSVKNLVSCTHWYIGFHSKHSYSPLSLLTISKLVTMHCLARMLSITLTSRDTISHVLRVSPHEKIRCRCSCWCFDSKSMFHISRVSLVSFNSVGDVVHHLGCGHFLLWKKHFRQKIWMNIGFVVLFCLFSSRLFIFSPRNGYSQNFQRQT
jgi:hypothetical protein